MKRLRRCLLPAILATIVLAVVGLADPAAAASPRPAAGQAKVTGSEPLAVYRTCIAYVGSPYPWDRDRGGVNSGANCNGVYGVSIITYLYHYEFDHWEHGGNNDGKWVYLGYVNGYKSSFAWDWLRYCYWKAESRVQWNVGNVTYMSIDYSPVVNVCS